MLITSSMRPPCPPCPLALVQGSATLRTRILTYIREYACVRACMICPHICMHAEDSTNLAAALSGNRKDYTPRRFFCTQIWRQSTSPR